MTSSSSSSSSSSKRLLRYDSEDKDFVHVNEVLWGILILILIILILIPLLILILIPIPILGLADLNDEEIDINKVC